MKRFNMAFLRVCVTCLFMGAVVCLPLDARTYMGRVVDEQGAPISYASVFLSDHPIVGTATGSDGRFSLAVPPDSVSASSMLVVSFMGYSRQDIRLDTFPESELPVQLKSQPIALEQTVVQSKRKKLSRRRLLAQVLHDTYLKIVSDMPQSVTRYQVVSDLRMDAQDTPWGMEEMLATIIEIPATDVTGNDSVQFVGNHCRRYCDPQVRRKVDTVLQRETDRQRYKMAVALDSGTLAHRALWMMRLNKAHFLDTSDELARWKMTAESDSAVVLTYTRKYNYLGIVKATIVENHVVDSYDYTLKAYTVNVQAKLFLPFSIRAKGVILDWLNLLNVGDAALTKFRLKRATMNTRISTLYAFRNGVLIPVEKNMLTTAQLEDNKGNQLPCECRATQHLTNVTTTGVSPLRFYRKNSKVERILVPIY